MSSITVNNKLSHYTHFKVKGVMIFLGFLSLLFFANSANAGLILNHPNYTGLNNGLVGWWSFDGKEMGGGKGEGGVFGGFWVLFFGGLLPERSWAVTPAMSCPSKLHQPTRPDERPVYVGWLRIRPAWAILLKPIETKKKLIGTKNPVIHRAIDFDFILAIIVL